MQFLKKDFKPDVSILGPADQQFKSRKRVLVYIRKTEIEDLGKAFDICAALKSYEWIEG